MFSRVGRLSPSPISCVDRWSGYCELIPTRFSRSCLVKWLFMLSGQLDAYALAQTAATMQTFYLAMVLYPEAQHEAQAEIDRVIGGDRFPTLADQPNLPYIDALVKEVLRWHPVVPLGKLSNFRSGYILHSSKRG